MGLDLLTPTHIIFLGLLALLLFGPRRLPDMGRSLGTGLREFKHSLGGTHELAATDSAAEGATPASPVAAEAPTATR